MGNSKLNIDLLLKMYATMRTIRRFEEVGMDMYAQGKVRGYFHSYIGQEAIAAGACAALRKDDYVVSNHRGHGHLIARGADPARMMAELFGKSTGYSGGRGGSMHMADLEHNNIGENGIVGAGIPIAAGVALGVKLEHSDKAVLCFFGDGASNSGLFAESLNMAAIYRLPLVFILENNCWAATTEVTETAACHDLYMRGTGYGVSCSRIYGNDVVEIYNSTSEALDRARSGEGPALIEALTYRMCGHHVNDPGAYMPPEKLEEWRKKNPIEHIIRILRDSNVEEGTITEIDSSVERKMIAALKFAMESPEPDPSTFLDSISEGT